MEYKGYVADIMEAERLAGSGVYGLPPGTALEALPADVFLKYPENWMKGPGVFVVPVRPGKGLWFNWCGNSHTNTAIVPTVKGCNPITGMETSGFHMERYDAKCPKHGCALLHDRFCPECDYKWPFGNYVAGPNTLWWDGFRIGDAVRQFFFTEDELRDIATAMIGVDRVVPAFGFAFFSPKVRREAPAFIPFTTSSTYIYNDTNIYPPSALLPEPHPMFPYQGSTSYPIWYFDKSITISSTGSIGSGVTNPKEFTPTSGRIGSSVQAKSCGHLYASNNVGPSGECLCMADMAAVDGVHEIRSMSVQSVQEPTKKVSVGAGARINQILQADPHPLDSWNDAPDSVMTIYFVFQEQFQELKAGGLRDFSGVKEGMLSGLPVG